MKRLALILTLTAGLSAAGTTPFADACALYDRGDYASAAAAFEQLAHADPDAPLVLLHLGKIAVHRRELPRAIECLSRAAARAPCDAAIALWLGNAHAWSASVADGFAGRVRHGRLALALYRRAVELDPENLPARFALMNFYRHVPAILGGGLDRARTQADEIARRDAIAGAHARALLAFHEKNYSVAFETLQLVLAEVPDHYSANFLLGRLAAASDSHRAAGRTALRRCLQLTPGENDDSHADARTLLAQLDGAPANGHAAR